MALSFSPCGRRWRQRAARMRARLQAPRRMRSSDERRACGYPSPVSPSLRDVDPPSPARGEAKKVRASHQPLFSSLLPLHRLPADVAAAEALGPVDLADRPISALLCLEDGLAGGADIQHAAAVGENLSIL